MERRKEKPLLTEGMTVLESLAQLQANYYQFNKISGCKINVQKNQFYFHKIQTNTFQKYIF